MSEAEKVVKTYETHEGERITADIVNGIGTLLYIESIGHYLVWSSRWNTGITILAHIAVPFVSFALFLVMYAITMSTGMILVNMPRIARTFFTVIISLLASHVVYTMMH